MTCLQLIFRRQNSLGTSNSNNARSRPTPPNDNESDEDDLDPNELFNFESRGTGTAHGQRSRPGRSNGINGHSRPEDLEEEREAEGKKANLN